MSSLHVFIYSRQLKRLKPINPLYWINLKKKIPFKKSKSTNSTQRYIVLLLIL